MDTIGVTPRRPHRCPLPAWIIGLFLLFAAHVNAQNIALLPSATVTASSENAPSQTAAKAFDGVPDGWPGDYSREWAATNNPFPSSAGGVGAWVQVSWDETYTVNQISLWDRPNSTDRVMGGSLLFSDGSTVAVGSLANNGSTPTVVNFTPRDVTSVRFTITAISSSTNNVGLAEFEVEGDAAVPPAGNQPPTANAGADQVVNQGDLVQLSGNSSSDPNSDPLTFAWLQTGGSFVALSNTNIASPTFSAPTGLSSNEVLTFSLTVDDGEFSGADSVQVTVLAQQSSSNIALLPTVVVSANAENLPSQGAAKARDGVPDGWPGDYRREWASTSNSFPTPDGTTGAWIRYDWPTAYLVDEVSLWDRPNTTDWVLGGQLTFSDGSSINVGQLPNNGSSPVNISFPARVITWVRFDINAVSNSTNNVGLSEFEVTGVLAGNAPPTANAGADQVVNQGDLVQLSGTSSSDPNSDPLTFAWLQTGGSSVALSNTNIASPTFSAPTGLSANEVLTFSLTVDDGEFNDANSVQVTVLAQQQSSSNIALLPTVVVSANAENLPSQGAAKARDGVPDGWPGDYRREWASTSNSFPTPDGTTGAWIRYDWPTAYLVDEVSLWDRPNTTDRVLGGQLTFSDGSSINVGQLPNNGSSPVNISFPARVITWVRFDINAVSNNTNNVGLSEFEVMGVLAGNLPPTANAGPDQNVNVGVTVQLDGSASSDPNADPLTYTWLQTGGVTVSLNSTNIPAPIFTAPIGLTVPEVLTFELNVSDGSQSDIDSISVTVVPPTPNEPPTANAGADQVVNQGDLVQLDGSGSSDPNSDPLTYAWLQTGGTAVTLSNSTRRRPTFSAPTGLSASEILTFSFTVDDGQFNDADSVNITVNPPGTLPVANAGGDQLARQGILVQLNGAASDDSGNGALSFSWLQIGGPTVSLSNSTVASPTFSAPAGAGANQLVSFELTVSNAGGSDTDTVNVTVLTEPASENVALLASASANSENLPSQGAAKAIDGVADGWPGDYRREWAATNNSGPTPEGTTSAWIRLDWNSSYLINQIVLYDRPNSSEHIRGGLLTFSDGSNIAVGALNNDGSAVAINFAAKQVRWVRFDVDAVSSGTKNVGLAEFEVFGTPGCFIYPSVSLIEPMTSQFQVSDTVNVVSDVCFDPALHGTWGIKYVIDGGPANGGSQKFEYASPGSTVFTNLNKAEHAVNAYVVDAAGSPVLGLYNSSSAINVGIGDYFVAIGDSITFGVGDDLSGDNTSADGRNDTLGYTPILVDLLSSARGYPNFVANEGVPGINTNGYLQILDDTISEHSDAFAYLVKLGVNDSYPILPTPSGLGLNPGSPGYPGSYKHRLQGVLDKLNAAGKLIYLSNLNPSLSDFGVVWYSDPSVPTPIAGAAIFEFNDVIDELAAIPANNIIGPIDLHTFFLNGQRYSTEYDDNIHPNGIGYQSMAEQWLLLIEE